MNKQFKEQFEQQFTNVFNTPETIAWRKGYNDAIKGLPCASNDKHYTDGFNKGARKNG